MVLVERYGPHVLTPSRLIMFANTWKAELTKELKSAARLIERYNNKSAEE